jgi:hypothetical protein
MTQARDLADTIRSGRIIQVQKTQFTGTNSVPLTALTDTPLTDLTVNITPTSTSSIIYLQAHIFCEFALDISSTYNHTLFFYRDTTKLSHPTAGNRNVGISLATRTIDSADDNSSPEVARYDYFDSPATTSQITYKCGIRDGVTDTMYINTTVADTNNAFFERGVSFISATEIAG